MASRKTEEDECLLADYLTGSLCCFAFHLECFYKESSLQRVIGKSAERKAFPQIISKSTATWRVEPAPDLVGPLQPQTGSSHQDLKSCHPDMSLQSLEGEVHASRRQGGCLALSESGSVHGTNH